MSKYVMTIGTDLRGHAFTLPSDAVTSKMVAFGGSGMGKTNLGSVETEGEVIKVSINLYD